MNEPINLGPRRVQEQHRINIGNDVAKTFEIKKGDMVEVTIRKIEWR